MIMLQAMSSLSWLMAILCGIALVLSSIAPTYARKTKEANNQGTTYQQTPHRLFHKQFRPAKNQDTDNDLSEGGQGLPPNYTNMLAEKLSARKNCALIEVQFNFDDNPEEISWMITLGDKSSVQRPSPRIVAHSHLEYQYIDRERHTVCLPMGGNTQYTFTIFDWSGNGMQYGSYTLLEEQGQLLVQGDGDFHWIKRHTFELPLPEAPSMSPSQSQSPTISSAPTFDCTYIDIEITYDMMGAEETSWIVTTGDYDALNVGQFEVVADSSLLNDAILLAPSSADSHRVCIPSHLGDVFSFVIFDTGGTGLSPLYGDGGYVITSPDVPGEIIGEGGEFTTMDIVTFRIPFQFSPSMSPSVSSQPTATSQPTQDCTQVEVRILFDAYPTDISWVVRAASANDHYDEEEILFESPIYDEENHASVYQSQILCFLFDGIFLFEIYDLSGDGLVGNFGEGYYALVAKDSDGEEIIVAQGSNFEYTEASHFSIFSGVVYEGVPQHTEMECYPVIITLSFGEDPEAEWAILSGESFDDPEATIVVESPSYDFFTHAYAEDVQKACLEEGQYIFVIDGGDGLKSYSVATTPHGDAGQVISQTDNLVGVESTSFNIPFTTSSTTGSEDSNICLLLSIAFDSYPYEFQWALCSGDMGCFDNVDRIIEESPYYNVGYRNSEESHTICLPRGRSHTFTVIDKGADGLCCLYGDGKYVLSLQNDGDEKVILAQGSDFGLEESVTFSIPCEDRLSTPSPSPVQHQSLMPSPPSTEECMSDEGYTPITITLQFDVFPHEIHWWLISGDFDTLENNEHEFIAKSPDYSNFDRFSTATYEVCLSADYNQYSFIIFDDASNGLSNEFGEAGYYLSHKGTIFAEGSPNFGFYDVHSFETPFSFEPGANLSTSQTPAPKPNCSMHMVKVVIEPDMISTEVRWEISSNPSSMEYPLIVARSESADRVSYACLGNGQYTFTAFGSSNYKLLLEDSIIAEGPTSSSFTLISLPSPDNQFPSPQPTPFGFNISPRPTPSLGSLWNSLWPTSSPPPIGECYQVTINIEFDGFPSETSWYLTDGYDYVEESPYYGYGHEMSTNHTLCLNIGSYEFGILDSSGDGICCLHGKGSYSLVARGLDEDKVVVKSTFYGFSETTEFSIPFESTPTGSPTASQAPTISAAPTASCIYVEVVINLDGFPLDTMWEIAVGNVTTSEWDDDYFNDATIVTSSPFYYGADFVSGTTKHTVCLPGRQTYTFTIRDGSGNGMCCFDGTGGYLLLLRDGTGYNVIIQGDGIFDWSESKAFDLPEQGIQVTDPRMNKYDQNENI